MKFIPWFATALLVTVAALSIFGFLWWGQPPDKIADYATGGRVILVLGFAASLFGLWRLWSTPLREEY